MSYADQYSKTELTWYLNFVSAELAEIFNYPSGSLNPYGPGNDVNSPIIALGEAWAYYMGHFLANQQYTTKASKTAEQTGADGYGIFYYPNGTNYPHLEVLENFNPNLSSDPFHWIPKGLFYDLNDTRNDFLFDPSMINDQVSGYTNQQLFNAFQSNIYTLQDFRIKLLQTTTNSTSAFVPNLFSQYGY